MFVLYRKRLNLLQDLVDSSQVLSPEDFNRMSKFIHTKDILSTLFLFIHLPNIFINSVKNYLRHLLSFYILIVSLSMDMFYVNCVCILKACFRKINENLQKLTTSITKDDSQMEILETEKEQFQQKLFLLMQLKHLEKKHLQISDSVRLLNKTFFIRIIVVTMSTFAVVTFNIYFYILWIVAGINDENEGNFWFKPYLPSAIYHLCKFAMMTWACESATNQSHKISTTIHDVLSTVSDVSIKRELRLFSMQLMHQDNKFTAKAITMNGSLFTQVVGGIVMYILILFQFLLNSVACLLKSRS
ncbi:uncharacterized protein LOC143183515 [Calliopsis andreniformis]|uniref:uncharacterized protein LOC143183515 n=1 Tax=Calliopsis andreniformis TaxID=337506 RepID=UPI003FCD94DF